MFWGKPGFLTRLLKSVFTKRESIAKSQERSLSMWRRTGSVWQRARVACLFVAAGMSSGCMTSNDELRFWGDEREITYYKDTATKVEYTDVSQASPEKVAAAQSPRRVGELRKDEVQNITLQDALKTAMMNAEVIRDNAQFLSPGNRLLNNPDFVTTVHDIAVQETNTLFGQGGIQAALAEFDATFTTNMTWGRSEQLSESATIGFGAFDEQDEEFGDFRAQLQKIFGHGGQLTLAHNWFYSGQNQDPTANGRRPFFSIFTSRPGRGQDPGLPTVGVEYREPLWQGRGTEYTRIAGPIARRPTLQSTPTVNQGVVIARIRTDISVADFEGAVATLLRDVEDVYWELYLAYRSYDTERVALVSALQTWREVKASADEGRAGAADEAQARDNYFEIRARSEGALSQLFNTEIRLRRLLGLASNDGNVLRPVTDPVTAHVVPDWNICLAEALAKRPELRRQKWNIKSLELQHKAAEMLVAPRLDFVARYQVNAFGDRLFGSDTSPNRSAYAALVQGDQTGWGLGFEFSMPIGFRGAMTQVQNLEHRLTKARAILGEQEAEVSLELASVMQQIAQNYQTAKTNFNRRRAAERRVQAFVAEYRAGRTTLDLVLRAQISLAQAETAYFSSLVAYNRALAELKFRKGSILVDNNVFLSESLWTPAAYEDAMRRAWERSFAFDAPNQTYTYPPEFAMDGECLAPESEWATHVEPIPDGEEELPPMVDPRAKPAVPEPAQPETKTPDEKSALIPTPAVPNAVLPNSATPNGTLPNRAPGAPVVDDLEITDVKLNNVSTGDPADVSNKAQEQPMTLDDIQSLYDPAPKSNFEQPIPAREKTPRISNGAPVDGSPRRLESLNEGDFQLPIPMDGGLSEEDQTPEFAPPIKGNTKPGATKDEFLVPARPASGNQQSATPTVPRAYSNGSSRRQLLSQSTLEQTPGTQGQIQGEPNPAPSVRSAAHPHWQPEIQQTSAEETSPKKRGGFPSWGRFFKRGN